MRFPMIKVSALQIVPVEFIAVCCVLHCTSQPARLCWSKIYSELSFNVCHVCFLFSFACTAAPQCVFTLCWGVHIVLPLQPAWRLMWGGWAQTQTVCCKNRLTWVRWTSVIRTEVLSLSADTFDSTTKQLVWSDSDGALLYPESYGNSSDVWIVMAYILPACPFTGRKGNVTHMGLYQG